MISSINSRSITHNIAPKHQNNSLKTKANEEANESTSEKIAEANKQSNKNISLQSENSKILAISNSKTETGNNVDVFA